MSENFSREFFVKKGKEGGNKLKDSKPKDYYKTIRKQRGAKDHD